MTDRERIHLAVYEGRDITTLTTPQLDEYADLLRKRMAELKAIIERLKS